MNENALLSQWSDKVDSILPSSCPGCKKTLDKVRYGYDRTRTTIHLTGAVNEYDYFVAECPYCGEKLLREGAGETHYR